MKDRLKKLQEIIDVQASDGNWNADAYMHGMLNGMLCAQATLTGEEPVYREAPAKWLRDQDRDPREREGGNDD